MVILTVIMGGAWKLKGRTKENRLFRIMILMVLFSCVVDPLCYTLDGKPGLLIKIVYTVGTYWEYVCNIIIGPAMLAFIARHIHGRFSKRQRILCGLIIWIATFFLLSNIIFPVIFSIDANNHYERGPLYNVFIVVNTVMLIDGIYLYVRGKIRGGVLKFFPVWQFILPLAIGLTSSWLFYGVSMIFPSFAVSIAGILYSLQNEAMYLDGLTGLYNRYYLEHIKEEISSYKGRKKKNTGITAMMLDMNGFKSINDRFGHATGDEALINMSEILRGSIGEMGSVIRYAGDEFIVLLNTQEERSIEKCLKELNDEVAEFNEKGEAPYNLSYSIGYSKLDLMNQTVNEIMNEIDRKMYEDKKRFYKENENYDRRRNRREN